MKKVSLAALLSAFVLAFSLTGCGVNPETIVLMAPTEIVNTMNSNFEGTFKYKSEEKNEAQKSISVIMDCEIGENKFEVEFKEAHKKDLGEFGIHYYNNEECFTTDYYSKRYEAELKKSLEKEVKDYFEDIGANPDFKLTTVSFRHFIKINQKFNSFDSFLTYYKDNGKSEYQMVVPFAKDSKTEFNQLLLGLSGEKMAEKNFKWVSGTVVYDPEKKFSGDTTNFETDYLIKY